MALLFFLPHNSVALGKNEFLEGSPFSLLDFWQLAHSSQDFPVELSRLKAAGRFFTCSNREPGLELLPLFRLEFRTHRLSDVLLAAALGWAEQLLEVGIVIFSELKALLHLLPEWLVGIDFLGLGVREFNALVSHEAERLWLRECSFLADKPVLGSRSFLEVPGDGLGIHFSNKFL